MRRFRTLPIAWILQVPLFRLLALNLGIGMAAAALMVGGLLLLNPHRLRDLIFADASSGAALVLLLFGFIITFGSAAMGAAIMAIGRRPKSGGGGLKMPALQPVPLPIRVKND
jgi:hypothetical protein